MKFNNNQTLAESVIMRGLDLSESKRWRDYTGAIREGYQEKHKTSIPDAIIATTATLLENTYQYAARMDETTRTVNLGTFIDYGFDVISATVPNLIAHDIVSVQPMNAKHGAIFYLQYLYGTEKGNIAAGTAMNSPFTGIHGATNFSNEVIEYENATANGTLKYGPIKSGTVSVFKKEADGNFTEVARAALRAQTPGSIAIPVTEGTDELAAIEGSGVTGTINLETRALSLTGTDGMDLAVSYSYDMDNMNPSLGHGFAQVDLDLASISLEAKPRKLRARWLLDAGFELQKMKGIDAESELVTAMSNEIKYEIDGEILKSLYDGANLTVDAWDCQMPGTYLSYTEYKRTIIDVFTELSNRIFDATKRVGANFIVAGINVCNIVETLPEFAPDNLGTKSINGPHKIGKLAGKWDVYKNPFYNDNDYVLGYKGNSWLDAGYVYAPYMPLYATPTQVLDDFIFRKGLATSYGKVMINNNLYGRGSIINFTASRMRNAVNA